ncbi:hypothetical protein B9479_006376 [Cryptococcus floricola]|uniref:ENTH domain-containing protein n=1 Tax=Cryptococcus floricola TaxID=2591691 RepID=A0A5D3ARZ1_9TREE|nr:hypothetical protein B9479_006376 [Cryptococcus floricola]
MASSLQHLGRGGLRVIKNYTKGYTDTQTKVRDATSNDPWGPSGTEMNAICQLTYNQNDFVEIMEMLDKRLNDKGKNWRHVFKALTLLDYCLHGGSENVVIYFKDNLYLVKTLKEFVYVDEDGKDVGTNVRQKAKDITNLLQDDSRLREERRSRGAMRDRMLNNIESSGLRGERDSGAPRSPAPPDSPPPRQRPARSRNEDDELERAIAESKRMSEDEAKRRSMQTQEEDELRRAIRESEQEEARRKREQEESTKSALFDDNLNLQGQNAYTQQQPDLFAQQTQQMPMQPTGGWPLVDAGWGQQQQLQPQYTSYNPFFAMQQQQQQEEYMRQQMELQEQQRQQQEWAQQQQYLQAQNTSLFAQPTGYGSNNPFAPGGGQSQPPVPSPQPQQQSSFLPVPSVTQQQPQPSFSPQPQEPPKQLEPQATATPSGWNGALKTNDAQHGGLASLLARGREDGLDTFGNQGNLRIPVGSGFHDSNRVAAQQTGAAGLGANNPFGQRMQQQGQQNGQTDQPFFSI